MQRLKIKRISPRQTSIAFVNLTYNISKFWGNSNQILGGMLKGKQFHNVALHTDKTEQGRVIVGCKHLKVLFERPTPFMKEFVKHLWSNWFRCSWKGLREGHYEGNGLTVGLMFASIKISNRHRRPGRKISIFHIFRRWF
jgi:hypothetical protein